jgi:hypothetical protein
MSMIVWAGEIQPLVQLGVDQTLKLKCQKWVIGMFGNNLHQNGMDGNIKIKSQK